MKKDNKTKNKLIQKPTSFYKKVKKQEALLKKHKYTEQDITKRKKADAGLVNVPQFHRELFDNVVIGLLRSTPGSEGTFVDVNPAMVKIFEADNREHLMSIHASEIYWDAGQRKIISDAIVSKGFAKEEVKYKTLKGKPIWCHINAVRKIDANGQVFFDATIEDITQRKRIEESLRESEEKFKSIFDHAADGIMIANMESKKFIDANRVMCEMLAYSLDEMKNMGVMEIHPQESLPYVLEQFEKMAKGEIALAINIPLKRKDGSIIYADVSSGMIKMSERNYLMGIFRDITERKRIEESLQDSEEQYKALFSEALDGICLAEVETGIIIDCNQALAALVGRSRAELIGQHQKILHPPQPDSPGFSPSFKQHTTEKGGQILETQVITGKGDIKEVEIKANLLDIHGKKIMQGIFRDITESKRAEEALKESEERFRIAAETSNDVVYEWDLKQSVKWFGKIDEMLGYNPGEFPRTLDGLGASVHPEDWVRVMAAVQAHLEGRAPYAEEYRAIKKDGTFRWWSARGAVARTPDGKPIRWIGTVTDITERKLSEDTLRIKNQVFEDSIASQSVANSTGIITHVNPAFLRLWGYTSKEQAIGNSVGSFFADQADASPVLEALATHDAWKGEFRAKRTDGTTFISRGFATSLRDTRGELVGYQSTNLDVTKERQAEEALRNANKNLEQRVLERTAELTRSKQILDETGRLARVGGWELVRFGEI